MFVAQSALAALVQRGVTDEGAVIDVAMRRVRYFDVPDRFVAHQRPRRTRRAIDRMLARRVPCRPRTVG